MVRRRYPIRSKYHLIKQTFHPVLLCHILLPQLMVFIRERKPSGETMLIIPTKGKPEFSVWGGIWLLGERLSEILTVHLMIQLTINLSSLFPEGRLIYSKKAGMIYIVFGERFRSGISKLNVMGAGMFMHIAAA